ncbi:hypothetical protein FRX31_027789 [Thalictrum thalictroides]|uniref:Secreted protein n=1 Tax=Thalictrum thalictroides TaxID=46969 RepID=A0A7J6VE72_THATH|nr:hypothetical protein FRX31_027789 [Thalictrum thalictroides]
MRFFSLCTLYHLHTLQGFVAIPAFPSVLYGDPKFREVLAFGQTLGHALCIDAKVFLRSTFPGTLICPEIFGPRVKCQSIELVVISDDARKVHQVVIRDSAAANN